MYKNGKKISLLQILIILAIIFGTVLYTVDVSLLSLPKYLSFNFTKTDWNLEDERKQQEHDWDSSYFVNTIGCKMPSFPVNSVHIEKFMSVYKPPVQCSTPMTKTDSNNLWIALNETELDLFYGVKNVSELMCCFYPLYRQSDDKSQPDTTKSTNFTYGKTVAVNYEFVEVVCRSSSTSGIIYKDHHFFFPPLSESNVRDVNYKPNVMVIGLDSISRLNFHRQMNKSVSVLLNQLKAIELFGFNKVEDNTYPNLIPVLTGLDKKEIGDACVPNEKSRFDRCHFIWDIFKHLNYSTLFAEDTAWLGLFNYFRGGFIKQPTDYYLRPIIVTLEKNKETKRRGNCFLCLGYKNSFDLFSEYISKFIDFIGLKAHFSFFWSSSYSHDNFLSPQLIDDKFSELLSNLPERVFQNTFLFVMSDHGIRFGSFRNTYQGMMEERQPFLFIVPPKTFQSTHSIAYKHLLKNRRRLTTHFDLYETLRDLSDPGVITNESIKRRSHELLDADPMPRGISLFLSIPPKRSCRLAGISPHWCTCHGKQELAATDPRVSKCAGLIVSELNQIVNTFPQCEPLSLNMISSANIFSTEIKGTEKDKNKFVDITVHLQTKPGLGEFEATVRVSNDGSLNMTGTISRVNLYGNQSVCVDDYAVKLYCYCKRFM